MTDELPAYRRAMRRASSAESRRKTGELAGVVPLPEPVPASLEVRASHLGERARHPRRVGTGARRQADVRPSALARSTTRSSIVKS